MGIFGIAKRGFGKALRAHRIKHGKRGKTITGVKPLSGKIPSYVRGTVKERANQVRTHMFVKRIDKVNEAKKKISEGKKTLKDMAATKQAKEVTDYKGKKTGDYRATEIREKD